MKTQSAAAGPTAPPRHRTALFGMLIVGTWASGCSDAGPQTVPVSGTVTFKGAPVKQVTVTFTTQQARPAIGVTNDEGRFKLTTFESNDGAIPGRYTVVIVRNAGVDENMIVTPKPDFRKTAAELGFPPKYANPATSELQIEVQRGATNSFTIELHE